MRKIILLLVIVILGFTSCQNKTSEKKNNTSSTNNERVEFAKNLSHKILTAQKSGQFYKLSEEEASLRMINGLSERLQKASYKQIKNLFGDYKSLKFESLVEIIEAEKYEIYRFKGEFEANSNVEIRAVLNTEGKLSGFFVKPWKDTL